MKTRGAFRFARLHELDDELIVGGAAVSEGVAPKAEDGVDQLQLVALHRELALVDVDALDVPGPVARDRDELRAVEDVHVVEAARDHARPLLEATPAAAAVRGGVAHVAARRVQRRRRQRDE
eukprot:5355595-Pleurochrysis_carterae.AAC.1